MKFAVFALLANFLVVVVVLSENLSEEKWVELFIKVKWKINKLFFRILERIAKLETLGEILTQNQKSLNNQIGVIESSLSLITDNTRKILDNQLEKILAISSCWFFIIFEYLNCLIFMFLNFQLLDSWFLNFWITLFLNLKFLSF